MAPISKQTIAIAGLNVHVYSNSATDKSLPVAAIFILHGRTGSAEGIQPVVESLFRNLESDSGGRAKEPIVITFDHRNHGTRLVDLHSNNMWSDSGDDRNDRHAIDMYAIQAGTARDVSFLIDFLPSYLYPSDEKTISDWIVSGISLGGHSTWISLANDPRVKVGIPIIGCPDYLPLISARAKASSVPISPPYFPSTFLSLLQRLEPASQSHYKTLDPANPFLHKKILVLSGEKDKLVPWTASKGFVDNLEVGSGIKKIVIVPNVGHECTAEMIAETAKFISKEVLNLTQSL